MILSLGPSPVTYQDTSHLFLRNSLFDYHASHSEACNLGPLCRALTSSTILKSLDFRKQTFDMPIN